MRETLETRAIHAMIATATYREVLVAPETTVAMMSLADTAAPRRQKTLDDIETPLQTTPGAETTPPTTTETSMEAATARAAAMTLRLPTPHDPVRVTL